MFGLIRRRGIGRSAFNACSLCFFRSCRFFIARYGTVMRRLVRSRIFFLPGDYAIVLGRLRRCRLLFASRAAVMFGLIRFGGTSRYAVALGLLIRHAPLNALAVFHIRFLHGIGFVRDELSLAAKPLCFTC
jgi:hypothetical protein